jgi:hypothetical protein
MSNPQDRDDAKRQQPNEQDHHHQDRDHDRGRPVKPHRSSAAVLQTPIALNWPR